MNHLKKLAYLLIVCPFVMASCEEDDITPTRTFTGEAARYQRGFAPGTMDIVETYDTFTVQVTTEVIGDSIFFYSNLDSLVEDASFAKNMPQPYYGEYLISTFRPFVRYTFSHYADTLSYEWIAEMDAYSKRIHFIGH